MSDETRHRPGDMRFDDGEIVMYDGKIWVPYRRIPVPAPTSTLRNGRDPEPERTARPGDDPAARTDG